MSYRRMTFPERMDIFRLLYVERLKPKRIAEMMRRSPSSITRELSKGMDNGMYNPLTAEIRHLKQRSNQRPHLKMTEEAWKMILPELQLRRPPQQIAQWLSTGYPNHAMPGKTIYNYVHLHMKGELKKLALLDLRQQGKKRKTGKTGEKRGKIPEMTLIDERPPEVNARTAYGNREGDLIIGKGHKSAICVLVERKSRYARPDLLEKYDAVTVRKTIEKRFKKLSLCLVNTLTLDQGHENSRHKELTRNTGVKVYFCHPHSPWEKGTCENTNYLVRDMLYQRRRLSRVKPAGCKQGRAAFE